MRQLANMYGYESERRHISSSDESLAWHMLHPEHGLKLGWDLAALLFVVYFAFTIPMRLGFDMETSPPEATLEFVMDLFFLVDILVSFRTAYKENGILVRDSASVAHHYLQTWFVFDVVASFPLDWIIPARDSGPSAYAFTMDVHDANYTTALEAAAAATELDAAAALEGMGSAEANQANRFIRLLRLVKLFRTLRLLKLFPRIVQLLETSVALNPSVVRFIRSIVFLLLVWHTLGCVYFYMVRDEYGGIVSCVAPPDPRALLSMSLGHDVTRDGYPVGNGSCYVHLCICGHASQSESSRVVLPGTDVSWYDPFNPDQWVTPPRSASWSISTKYWQSVFWAVTVTTGIGYDILPRSVRRSLYLPLAHSPALSLRLQVLFAPRASSPSSAGTNAVQNQEVVFTTLMTIVGLIMYSIVIGSASSALTNLDSSATQQRQVLDRVSAYMRSRHVPMFFQRIIRDFYRHMWSSISMQEDVFEDLPPSLKHRLEVVMNRDLIDRIPVLQTLSADVFIRLVQRLEHHTFLPGEYIARQGEAGGALFFTLRGRVDAVLPNGVTVFQTFVPGSFFGEGSLLERRKRDASYRAVDFVDLLSLGRADFDELRVVAPRFLASLTTEHAARQKERMRVEREFAQQLAAAALGTDSAANTIQGGRTGARSRRESLGAMLDDSCASIAVESLVSCCPTDRLRHATRRWLLCRVCWGRGGCCADESETAESGMDITSRASGMWDSVRSLSTRFGGMFHASTRSVGVEPSPTAPHGVATNVERSVPLGAVAGAPATVANAPLAAEHRANPAPALPVRHRSLKEPTGTHVVLSAPPPSLAVRSARSSRAMRGDEDRVTVLVWQAEEPEAGGVAGGDVEEPTRRLPTPTDISASADVVALPGAVSGSSEAADAVPEPGGGVDSSARAAVEQPEDCDHREREGRADPASRTTSGMEGADAVSHDPAWHEAMQVLGDLEREALAHCSEDEE